MKVLKYIANFFAGFTIITILSTIFSFIGRLDWGLFSAISGVIGIVLEFPMSLTDLIIMGYKLNQIVFVIGMLVIVFNIYDFIKNYYL